MSTVFIIPGEPGAKQRPRFSRVSGGVKTYTPGKTASYENLIKLEYENQCRGVYFPGMVGLLVCAFFPVPKSAAKKDKSRMIGGYLRPTKKPDWDNIGKVVSDALNGIAYKDDSQIVCAGVHKFYSEKPRVEVHLWSVEEDAQPLDEPEKA